MIITLLSFFILTLAVFASVSGFGKLFLVSLRFNSNLVNNYKVLEFVFGLIVIGFFGMIINYFTKIHDGISFFFIGLGILLYLIFFIKKKTYKNELLFIIVLIFISAFFSFYSLSNDDFNYHFKTIINFKQNPLIIDFLNTIQDSERISFNSHWLLINSIYYLSEYPFSIFCITSILYTLTIRDFYFSYIRNHKNLNFLPTIYSFFVLLFLLGVINYYKEYGTDFPGQIIILIILLIFFENNLNFSNKKEYSTFLILVSLSFFALSIKLINILIFLLLFFIFFRIKKKVYVLIVSSILSIPFNLWLIQNYLLTGCFLWPLPITCFKNSEQAADLYYVIEMFSKSLWPITQEKNRLLLENFNWVPIWFDSHFIKILETYMIYTIILIVPYAVLKIKNRKKISLNLVEEKNNIYKLQINNPYLVFSFVSFFSTIIWFIKSPGYRFGISYNLNFIIIFLIPLWHYIYFQNKKFFQTSIKIIMALVLVFFIYKNALKTNIYFERIGSKWPNIIDGKYFNTKFDEN